MSAHRSVSSSHSRPGAGSTEIELEAQLVLGGHESIGIPVRFGYRREDPFAVALEFLGPAADAGTWRFSRDLLTEGLQNPTGIGDVRIWPPCPCHGRPCLRIRLRGDQGSVLLDLPGRQLRRWLRRESYALVPQGQEANLIDWEAELDGLVD